VERTVLKAIKHDIAIYAAHTNLDNVKGGVNFAIAERLGLQNPRILDVKRNLLKKLTVFVPIENTQTLLDALHEAGAGNIGNYSHCSFATEGTGTFLPNKDANPAYGENGQQETVKENRVEVVFPAFAERNVIAAMHRAHVYEEVAYYCQPLDNAWQEVGSGAVGTLPLPLDEAEFMEYLKEKMQLQCLRHTPLLGKKISKVAVCGGSGSFLLPQAIRQNADIFITADFKYHEFFDADGQIIIADIGHYESEIFTKELFFSLLSEKFSNIALNLSKIVTNPINYC
jgi:hypothetical protein